MSSSNSQSKKAIALKYDGGAGAPFIVATGMGYAAEKIVEIASDNGVPVFEDNSLVSVLSQLQLGQEVPQELYKMIVDIYVYFLNYVPGAPLGKTIDELISDSTEKEQISDK